jgi:TPR repeat protein
MFSSTTISLSVGLACAIRGGRSSPARASAILLLAREGNADAQYELGQRIISSQDSSFDREAGERWLQRAAQKNHREAQFLLGSLYWNGTLKDKSQKQVLNWLRKAADAGMSAAIELLSVVEEKNSKDQIAEWNHRQVLEVKAEAIPKAPPLIKVVGKDTNFCDGSLGHAWSGAPRDKVDLKLLLLGDRRGNKCLSNAIDKLSASNLARADVASSAPSLALQIATMRGYLELGSNRGMDGVVDGADPLFDQRRAAFIAGVKEGLDGEDPDECAQRYAVR